MSAHDTDKEYATALGRCRQIFAAKLGDYGASWRIMRPEAITDQLFIKAKRIRTLQTGGVSKVGEGILPEFIGIVNYGIIGVIQLRLGYADTKDIDAHRDLILTKIERTKEIEDHKGVTKVSEGIDANYFDMVNYAIFAIIKLDDEA